MFALDFLRVKSLIIHCILYLLLGLLNAGIHPVRIIKSRLDGLVSEFFLDVQPDLSILEIGVELDDLHLLLFLGGQLMQVETYSVEHAEDRCSEVVVLRDFLHKSICSQLSKLCYFLIFLSILYCLSQSFKSFSYCRCLRH